MNLLIMYLSSILMFILPIPHTIGIRNIIAGILTIIILIQVYKNRNKLKSSFIKIIKIPLIILSLLTLWIFINAFFISIFPHTSQREIIGQWLVPMVYLMDFILIGFIFNIEEIKKLMLFIFTVIFIHILYVDLYVLHNYISSHNIITRVKGLEEGPDKSNYLTNIILSFLAAEVIYRIRNKKIFLPFSNTNLFLIFIITILSSVFEGMRNGVVAILFLGLSVLFFSFYKNNKLTLKFKVSSGVLLIILFSIPAYYNFTHDPRWKSLIQTIPIALDTKHHKAWLDKHKYPYPKLPNGSRVSSSNYERVAWAYEGMKIIIKNPLGVGFGRNAFGHAIQKEYHLKKRTLGHSHSGIIDLTIALGFPGLILWLSFVLYLLIQGLKLSLKNYNFLSLILIFNITGFVSRWLVDSNMRDHMFLMFLVIIGISYSAMFFYRNEK